MEKREEKIFKEVAIQQSVVHSTLSDAYQEWQR